MKPEFSTSLSRLLAGESLEASEMEAWIGRIMDGELDEIQTTALLVALAAKGEAVEESSATDKATPAAAAAPAKDDKKKDGVACVCDEGKKGGTAWCDACGVGYTGGLKFDKRADYDAAPNAK